MVEGRRSNKSTNKRRRETTSRSRTQVRLAGLQVKNRGWPGWLRLVPGSPDWAANRAPLSPLHVLCVVGTQNIVVDLVVFMVMS